MKIQQVKKLPVEERFLYWIKERESIRVKKEAGEPKPWTDDIILQSYRFCNVRRMDDKVSRWLLKNWYEPYFDHPNMLLAVGIARHFNKPMTLDAIGFPERWNSEEIIDTVHNCKLYGPVFNAAYVIAATGGSGSDKVKTVVEDVVEPLGQVKGYGKSMKELWAQLLTMKGLGTFMAGQLVADMRWAVKGIWKDRLNWAPVGPGSRRGMNRYQSRDVNYPLSQHRFLAELRQIISMVRELPDIGNRLEAHDVQNCFCEFSKYEKVLAGQGKPKQRYNGG